MANGDRGSKPKKDTMSHDDKEKSTKKGASNVETPRIGTTSVLRIKINQIIWTAIQRSAFISESNAVRMCNGAWYLDLGATDHMTRKREWFKSY